MPKYIDVIGLKLDTTNYQGDIKGAKELLESLQRESGLKIKIVQMNSYQLSIKDKRLTLLPSNMHLVRVMKWIDEQVTPKPKSEAVYAELPDDHSDVLADYGCLVSF